MDRVSVVGSRVCEVVALERSLVDAPGDFLSELSADGLLTGGESAAAGPSGVHGQQEQGQGHEQGQVQGQGQEQGLKQLRDHEHEQETAEAREGGESAGASTAAAQDHVGQGGAVSFAKELVQVFGIDPKDLYARFHLIAAHHGCEHDGAVRELADFIRLVDAAQAQGKANVEDLQLSLEVIDADVRDHQGCSSRARSALQARVPGAPFTVLEQMRRAEGTSIVTRYLDERLARARTIKQAQALRLIQQEAKKEEEAVHAELSLQQGLLDRLSGLPAAVAGVAAREARLRGRLGQTQVKWQDATERLRAVAASGLSLEAEALKAEEAERAFHSSTHWAARAYLRGLRLQQEVAEADLNLGRCVARRRAVAALLDAVGEGLGNLVCLRLAASRRRAESLRLLAAGGGRSL